MARLVRLMTMAIGFPQRPLIAVMEPLRKSPNSKIRANMLERCCSRAARGLDKVHLLVLTPTYVRIITIKKENCQDRPCESPAPCATNPM